MNLEKVQVNIKINEQGYMLAQAEIKFEELITIRGYRVMASKENNNIYLSPPSTCNKYKKYTWIVKIEDTSAWESLQSKVIEEYKKEKGNNNNEFSDITEDVKPEDIPS